MKYLHLLIALLASSANAHGNTLTCQELVCQHCNSYDRQDADTIQMPRVGKAGPPGVRGRRGLRGFRGPRGLPGKVNETALRQIVREEIEIALEAFRIQYTLDYVPSKEIAVTMASDRDWTVIQRRVDGSVDFNRLWNDYVEGFGNKDGEFWLGLEKIHQLTRYGGKELRIDMIETDGTYRTAKYSSFSIEAASDNYRLRLAGYSGNATDSFAILQNNVPFSTRDADHDGFPHQNCASLDTGGWWFNACHNNLNGLYGRDVPIGVIWWNADLRWDEVGSAGYMKMRFTEMKIRRSG